jgi:hypothetical protein
VGSSHGGERVAKGGARQRPTPFIATAPGKMRESWGPDWSATRWGGVGGWSWPRLQGGAPMHNTSACPFKTGQKEGSTGGPGATVPRFESIQTGQSDSKILNLNFKLIQTLNNPKRVFPCSEKIEIKYGFEEFEEGNNVLHRNFFKFEVYFE